MHSPEFFGHPALISTGNLSVLLVVLQLFISFSFHVRKAAIRQKPFIKGLSNET